MDQVHALLIKILDAVGYQDDKDQCAKELEIIIQSQATLDLIESLPTHKQEEIQSLLANHQDDDLSPLLADFYSPPQVQAIMEAAAIKIVTDYIQTIKDSLSPTHTQQLKGLLEEVR
jgi:hypothetical protein